MSREYYSEVLALRDKYGWDNKEWARHTGIVQNILEAADRGELPDDNDILKMLMEATKENRRTNTSKMLRFKSPVIVGACLHKGGSGKTTCLVNIADDLATRGYNVLFIDSDSQMNATTTLLPGEESEMNLFTAFSNVVDIRKFIRETQHERLDIVPGSRMMGAAEAVLSSQAPRGVQPAHVFRKVLEGVIQENYYDFVFVDMDKSVGILNHSILAGCTHMLVVSECAGYCVDGISDVVTFSQNTVMQTNPELQFLGIVLNKVSARKRLTKTVMDGLDESFPGKRFQASIRVDANVEQSQWEGQTIREYNHRCNAWKDIMNVTDELIGRVKPMAV